MKIMICGKGGSGKSTMTALLARALTKKGKTVLVVDGDESNLCLHRLLGVELPEILMDSMGGRQGTREIMNRSRDHNHEDDFFAGMKTINDLPADCIAADGNLKLLVIGKIKQYGEGCACMIGGISRGVLSNLQEDQDEFIIIDAEAGLEHFGRRIDANCDLILSIIDPSFESMQMAGRAHQIAKEAGVQAYYVLNKVTDDFRQLLSEKLDGDRIIGAIPQDRDLFMASFNGEPITMELEEIDKVCEFITGYRKPVSLAVTL